MTVQNDACQENKVESPHSHAECKIITSSKLRQNQNVFNKIKPKDLLLHL